MTKARLPRLICLSLLGLLVTCAGLLPFDAFAQINSGQQWASKCSMDGTIYGLFCSLSNQFRYLPKTMAILSYAAAGVLVMMGLLNLKAYGDDPSSVPLRSIVLKFVIATMFISLPLAMQVFIGTVMGRTIDENNTTISRPCLMTGSNLMALRKNGGQSACR